MCSNRELVRLIRLYIKFSKRFSRPNISICFGTRPGTFFALASDTIMGWQKAKITKVPWIFLCAFSLFSRLPFVYYYGYVDCLCPTVKPCLVNIWTSCKIGVVFPIVSFLPCSLVLGVTWSRVNSCLTEKSILFAYCLKAHD